MHSLVLQHLLIDFPADSPAASLALVEQRAIWRAERVYEVIDNSGGFFRNPILPPFRSRMSVPCRIGAGDRKELEQQFVLEAKALGMTQLFGHPVSGGIRVTLYNGVSDKAVAKVVVFMEKFARAHFQEL